MRESTTLSEALSMCLSVTGSVLIYYLWQCQSLFFSINIQYQFTYKCITFLVQVQALRLICSLIKLLINETVQKIMYVFLTFIYFGKARGSWIYHGIGILMFVFENCSSLSRPALQGGVQLSPPCSSSENCTPFLSTENQCPPSGERNQEGCCCPGRLVRGGQLHLPHAQQG